MRRQGAMCRQGMCRHNASSGGPGASPMHHHNASSASARNVLPKLRVPCICIFYPLTAKLDQPRSAGHGGLGSKPWVLAAKSIFLEGFRVQNRHFARV